MAVLGGLRQADKRAGCCHGPGDTLDGGGGGGGGGVVEAVGGVGGGGRWERVRGRVIEAVGKVWGGEPWKPALFFWLDA